GIGALRGRPSTGLARSASDELKTRPKIKTFQSVQALSRGGARMKFAGQVRVKAPREKVFAAVRDARFFASCVDGVSDLTELAPDRYAAVLETKVAYMSFRFKVVVELVRVEPPREIEA